MMDRVTHQLSVIRRRHSPLKLKRNEKGETLLHRACIDGNLQKVLTLIEKGHEVNPRDNSGWLPIHEACNYGYSDVVELLLGHGARVNDTGGAECGGITPLHDACSGGHTQVIQLLIDNRANVIALDKQGQLPVDALVEYRERNRSAMSEDETKEIFSMEKQLMTLMRSNPGYTEAMSRRSSTNNICSSRLRSKNSKPTLPALLPEDEVVEDWLIIDHKSPRRKKRRRDGSKSNKVDQFFIGGTDHHFVEQSPVMDSRGGSSDDDSQSCRITQASLYSDEANVNNSDDDNDDVVGNDDDSVTEVMDNELWRDGTDDIMDTMRPVDLTNDYLTSFSTQNHMNTSTLRLRITVGNHRFLVPINSSDLERYTVRWLSEELSLRYSQLYNIRPQLILSLKDGAKLTPTDRLCDVLIGNDEELVASDIKWNISNVKDRYMEECAKLNDLGQTNVRHVIEELDTGCDFSCCDFSLTCKQFQPLIKSICYHNNLRELDLSGNRLEDGGFGELVTVLPLFSNIRLLNVSRNGLTSKSLDLFCEMLMNHYEAGIMKLEELILNYNSLFSDSSNSRLLLHKLLASLSNLSRLSLVSTRLSLTTSYTTGSTSFSTGLPVEPLQSSVEYLDISSNHVNALGISLLFEEMFRFSQLKNLHLSRALSIASEHESSNLVMKLQSLIHSGICPLQELHFNNCVIGRNAVHHLCRLISGSSTLKCLSISDNETIETEDLHQIIDSITAAAAAAAAAAAVGSRDADVPVRNTCVVSSLTCKDCNIVAPLQATFLTSLRENLQLSRQPLKFLQLTVTSASQGNTREDVDGLCNIWQDKWGAAAVCEFDEDTCLATLRVD